MIYLFFIDPTFVLELRLFNEINLEFFVCISYILRLCKNEL